MWQGRRKSLRGTATRAKRIPTTMDITLHIGAHRTGTTCFQRYMRHSRESLQAQKVDFWGPGRTRRGMMSGFYKQLNGEMTSAEDLVAVPSLEDQLRRTRASGVRHLIVSEENILGSVRKNVKAGSLYPNAAEWVSCFMQGFGKEVKTILISVRSLDLFWCSSLAYAVANDLTTPDKNMCAAIARNRRGWRDVITDVARAVPDADVRVLPFEPFAGRPDEYLICSTGIEGPMCTDRSPVHASPQLPELRRALLSKGKDASVLPLGTGRWNPFTNEEHCALRELFADDMMWLNAGADGLATLIEDRGITKAGPTLPLAATNKGQFDECEERRLARPG